MLIFFKQLFHGYYGFIVHIYIAVSAVSPICSSSDVTGLTMFFARRKSLGPVKAIPIAPTGAVSKITRTANVKI